MAQNRYYASTAKQASLAASVDSVVESITLDLVTGFPSNYPFTLVIDPDTNKEELVRVNNIAGTIAAVTRGQDGTTNIAHSIGATVRHVVSGQDFNEFSAHAGTSVAPTTSGVHGVTGDVVGTSDAQTLTNKIISGAVVANGGIQFEGATADAYETTLTVVDPTADRTITLPNATGTVTLDGVASTLTSKTITSGTLGSDLAAATYKITGLGTPSADTDASTKKYVDDKVAAIVASAPAALDTLDELAAALGDDANFATTVATSIGTKVAKAGDSMTGALSMGNNKITNLATPTLSTDAVPKSYIDTVFGSTTSAAASATAAAGSASSAATSASSAATSAASALTSASSAATSAASAATSASSASTSYSSVLGLTGSGIVRDMGSITVADTTSSTYINIATIAAAAATSASSASISETNANTSKLAAAASATAAATSATSASASATAAATSATSASASATAAATSASSASTSASAAATSASNAATSATSAAASASTASTSAANAATSATSAATSATSAATSETAAAASATAAATSATSASASASAAATSASSAATSATSAAASAVTAAGYVPSLTGNAGKYLTNNGTATSWAEVVTDPIPSVLLMMGA